MSNYSTKGVEEKEFVSKFIEPGIQIVKIVNIVGEEPEGRSPKLTFSFINADKKTVDVPFYMSTGAMAKSKEKYKHIATKCVSEAAIDAVDGNSLAEYGQNLNALLSGKYVRLKFIGEEVQGKPGKNNWWKATLGLPKFAEACKEGGEYDVVADEDTKLIFDKTNKWDYKYLPVANVETEDSSIDENDDDAPF